MISHRRAQELISARFDQPLDPIDNRELLTHLATCPVCQRFAEQANILARGLRDLPQLPASPSVNRQVLERISAGRSPWAKFGQLFNPSRSPVAVATAALIVIAIAAFAVILRSGVEPQSHVAAPAGVTATYQARATATRKSSVAQVLTPTPTPTATPAPTATVTAQPTATEPVAAPTQPVTQSTETVAPTAAVPTATPTQSPGIEPANVVVPTATATATGPSTAVPPTAPPMTTQPPPTVPATETATTVPTTVPTATAAPTDTPTEVPTVAPTETPTEVPTATPMPTEIPTEVTVPTLTEGANGSPVAVPPEQHRPEPTPTEPPIPTPTPEPTATATATPTQSIQPVSGGQVTDPPLTKNSGGVGTANLDPALTPTPPSIVPRNDVAQADDPPAQTSGPTVAGYAPDTGGTPTAASTAEAPSTGIQPVGGSSTVATEAATQPPTPEETAAATVASGADIASAQVVGKLPSGSSAPAGPLQVAASDDAVVILGPNGGLGVDDFSAGFSSLGNDASRGIWSPKGILLLVSYVPGGGSSPSIAVFDRDTGTLTPVSQQAQDQPAHHDVPAGWIGQDLYYLRTFPDQNGRVELHRAFYDGSDDQVIWSSDQLGLVTDQPIPTGDGFLLATDNGWLLIDSNGDASDLGSVVGGGAITQGSVSPSDDQVAYVEDGQLVIAPLSNPGSASVALPYSGADGTGYSWSPSGRYLVISDGQTLHIYANDGTLLETLANSSGEGVGAPQWMSDGIWFIVPGDPATIRSIPNESLSLPN